MYNFDVAASAFRISDLFLHGAARPGHSSHCMLAKLFASSSVMNVLRDRQAARISANDSKEPKTMSTKRLLRLSAALDAPQPMSAMNPIRIAIGTEVFQKCVKPLLETSST